MNDWIWPILFAAGAIFIGQNLVGGIAKGVIEMRSLEVRRDDQPALYWFAFTTEALFLVAFLFLLAKWAMGDLAMV